MKPQIGAYCRISYDRDGRELGIERQLSDLTALAERRGWEIAESFIDNDVSAFKKTVTRPGFEQMYERLKENKTLGIASYDLDRLWRQPRDLERIIDLYENNPRPFATIQGDVDLSTSNGRAMARVMVAFANKSSEDSARRIKRKIQEQAENGIPHWASRPYGYNRDGSLHEEESATAREMFNRFLKGHGYREIAWSLNEANRLNRGAKWGVGTIRKHIANPKYAAIRVHDGIEYPGAWQPIVSPTEWEAVKLGIARRKASFKGVPNNARYMLTGVLVCKCGNYLRGMTKRDGKTKGLPEGRLRRTYQCYTSNETTRRLDTCAGTCVGSEPLEHFLKEAIIYRLDSQALTDVIADRGVDDAEEQALKAEVERLKTRGNALYEDYVDETFTKQEYLRAVAIVRRKQETVQADLDALRRSRLKVSLDAGQTVREAWESNGDVWRRELVDVLIERVVVNKSSFKPYYVMNGKRTRFDVERVEIQWKF